MSRERLYLDNVEAIEEVLCFTCRRHRCCPDEAEDFAGWTRLKLVEDDYGLLASFEGRSQMRTFLRIVVQRLFLDYQRAKSNPPMSRERLYLDHIEAIEEVLSFTCRRHRCSQDEAEEFASWARLKLVEDNYGILASFEGRSKIHTFLRIVVQRLFLDYRRAKWGRWRPSEEAKRMGPLAVRLEALRWRDGMTLDDAYRCLQAVDPDLTKQQVEEIAARLPIRKPQPIEEEHDLSTVPSPEPTPEAEILENETEAARRRATTALLLLLQQLPPQDQLIFCLRFAEGMQIVDIAARLHLEATPLYRRLDRLKVELRRGLMARGFAPEVLGWPAAVPTPRRRDDARGGSSFSGKTRTPGCLSQQGEEP